VTGISCKGPSGASSLSSTPGCTLITRPCWTEPPPDRGDEPGPDDPRPEPPPHPLPGAGPQPRLDEPAELPVILCVAGQLHQVLQRDMAEVRMFLGELGRSSMGSFYELWMQGTKYAEGAAKMVWIDVPTGRPIPFPEHIATPLRDALAAAS